MMAMVTFANAAHHMYTKNRIVTTNISQLKGKIFYLNVYVKFYINFTNRKDFYVKLPN